MGLIRSAYTRQQMRMGAVRICQSRSTELAYSRQSWLTLPGEVGLYVENPCTWPRRAEVAFPALYWPKRGSRGNLVTGENALWLYFWRLRRSYMVAMKVPINQTNGKPKAAAIRHGSRGA